MVQTPRSRSNMLGGLTTDLANRQIAQRISSLRITRSGEDTPAGQRHRISIQYPLLLSFYSDKIHLCFRNRIAITIFIGHVVELRDRRRLLLGEQFVTFRHPHRPIRTRGPKKGRRQSQPSKSRIAVAWPYMAAYVRIPKPGSCTEARQHRRSPLADRRNPIEIDEL